jgi:hypothetical protein
MNEGGWGMGVLVSEDKLKKVTAKMAKNPAYAKEVAEDPDKAFRPAYIRDTWVYRIVVISLGSTVLFAVLGTILLQLGESAAVEQPPLLLALGSAAVGALAGLLAPSPTGG